MEDVLSDKKPKIDFELVKDVFVKLVSSSNNNLSWDLDCNENYLWVLDLFKQDNLSQLMVKLSPEEQVVIFLNWVM